MRRIIFSLALLPFMLMARAADGVNAILLEGPSGNFTVLLDEQPVVTFSGDDFVVTTHMGASLSVPASYVTKWTYVYDEEATSLKNAARFGSLLSFDGKHLGLSNLAPSSAVQVYTSDGALVASAKADSHGSVSLSVPERQGAVYLVKTSSVTFKVSKP